MPVDPTCPVCQTADIICGKWTLLLIRDLAEGHSRFCELERALAGISPRALSPAGGGVGAVRGRPPAPDAVAAAACAGGRGDRAPADVRRGSAAGRVRADAEGC